MFEQEFEGAAVGVAREELGAIDEVQQRHRLAAQAVDDVAVVDDMPVLAVRPCALSMAPFSWAMPWLLRVGVMP